MSDQGQEEQNRGWVRDDSLDGQLAHALGAWIGRAEHCNMKLIPAPPGSIEPVVLLTLKFNQEMRGIPR